MPLIVEPKSSFELTQAEGPHLAVVVAVRAHGQQWNMELTKINDVYLFGLQLEARDSQGERILVCVNCTDTWAQNSKLPDILTVLLGFRPKKSVDLETTLGRSLIVMIKHAVSGRTGKPYNKVIAFSPLAPGRQPLAAEAFTPPDFWDIPLVPALPGDAPAPKLIAQPRPQQKKIAAPPLPSSDRSEIPDPQPKSAEAAEAPAHPDEIGDDDCPF